MTRARNTIIDEAALCMEISSGNEHAFKEMYDRYWNKVYSHAVVYLKKPELAQDVMQEVFLKLWNNREKLARVLQFESYLFIITRNEIVNSLRKEIRSILIPDENHLVLADDITPYRLFLQKATYSRLHEAVELLPSRQRIIFKMSRTEGLSHAQIAQKLGLKQPTVKNQISRSLDFLRTYLQAYIDICFIFLVIDLLCQR